MTNQSVIIETYDPPMVAVRDRPASHFSGHAWVVSKLIRTNTSTLYFETMTALPSGKYHHIFIESYFVSELVSQEEWDKLVDDKLQDEMSRLGINRENSND